jgi:hypothetical protein
MTSTFPQPTRDAYRLSDDLRENGGTANVRTPLPDEADREELLLAKLGLRGWRRLHHFRRDYSAGWGERSGKPLSPRALETFFRFLERATFPKNSTPSLFLTDNGGLELCWEDAFGKSVQVEFTSTGIEYYLESRKFEGVAPAARAADMATELTAI